MIKEILGRDLDNDVCIEGLRGDFARQFSDGDFVHGSCQEVCCGDLAKRASIEGFAEILLRDLGKGPQRPLSRNLCREQESSCRDLIKRS